MRRCARGVETRFLSFVSGAVAFFVIIFFVTACAAPTVKPVVDENKQVQAFLSLFPDARYADVTYAGATVDTIRDVYFQECGAASELPAVLTRATYVAKAAMLSAYIVDGEVACVASKLNQDAFTIKKGDPASVEEGTLLTVNGEPVMLADLQAAYNQLPENVRNQTSTATLLNQLVDQRLLRQAAAGIVVSDEELATEEKQVVEGAGLASADELKASLEAQGVSYDDFLAGLEERLRTRKLLEQENVTVANVSLERVRQFYLDNPNLFLVSEQVRFRQLFFSFSESGSESAAAARAEAAFQALQKMDFCEGVREFSDDVESKERCGEYVTPRGVLNPALEAAIFSLQAGESSVIKGPAGYHIIVVLEHQQSSVVPYAQAEQQLIGILKNDVVQQRLSLYLLRLRADAVIRDYSQYLRK